MPSPGRAAVLGAGIQGTTVALALAADGWSVQLVDRAPEPLLAASVRGEGKLHLGYVYANDPGRATASLMVRGALAFSDLVDRWLPRPLDWRSLRSMPFRYVALPDSMVSPDDLAQHYAWVDAHVQDHLDDGGRYAGMAEVVPAEPIDDLAPAGLADAKAAWTTGEVAVDPTLLRAHLVAGLEAADVAFLGGTTVHEAERTPAGFQVAGVHAGRPWTTTADVVVNCLWDGRLALDRTLGIEPPRPWLYRLKYGIHGTVPPGAPLPPSATLVLGPFGDVVQRADGRCYASWYPECHTDTSHDLLPPATWADARSAGTLSPEHRRLAERTVAALARHVPALALLRVDVVAAGVIVAWGETDIDHVDSELHHRHQVGVHDHGDGHLSVDTGKLTTAPLFASQVAAALRS